MSEIEVKIMDIDPVEIVKILKDNGAEKVEQGLVLATYMDFPDRRLMAQGSFVRIRSISDRIELVTKRPNSIDDFKDMEEIETTINDYDTGVKIFKSIGLDVFGRLEKYRATYMIGDTKFEFDKLPGVPWYMEVEAKSRKDVETGVILIGKSMDDTSSMNTHHVLAMYDLGNFLTFDEKGEAPSYDGFFE